MDDTIGPDGQGEFKGSEAGNYNPYDWISADELLFNAIQNTSSACDGESDAYAEINEDFSGEEEYEDEDEHRLSTVRVLATMRPQLPRGS